MDSGFGGDAPKAAPKSSMVDWAMIAVICLVVAMAFIPAARNIGILLGASWGSLGALVCVGIIVWRFIEGLQQKQTRKELGDKDFSSLPPAEEAVFIPHDRQMRANASKAAMVGLIVALVMFGFGLTTAAMYSPCNSFCERPPSSCKGQHEDQWMASCPATCDRFEKAQGDKAVETLKACAFSASGGGGAACEKVTADAIAVGLACAEKK